MATLAPTGLMLPRPSLFYLVHTPGPSEDLKIWVGKQSYIIFKKAKVPLCGEGGIFLYLHPRFRRPCTRLVRLTDTKQRIGGGALFSKVYIEISRNSKNYSTLLTYAKSEL